MRKPHFIYNDLYLANLYFCPGYSLEEVRESVKATFDIDLDKDFSGCMGSTLEVCDGEKSGIYIWINTEKFTASSISVLAHEALHATNMILSRTGVKVDIDSNDEAQAYLLGWIVKKLLETYKN